MNIFKRLFRKTENKDQIKPEKQSDFSIEYYPLTGRYYPKYKDYYLKTHSFTGIVEKKEDYLFVFADYGDTEQQADKIIEKFKEQYLKENVQTIKR